MSEYATVTLSREQLEAAIYALRCEAHRQPERTRAQARPHRLRPVAEHHGEPRHDLEQLLLQTITGT